MINFVILALVSQLWHDRIPLSWIELLNQSSCFRPINFQTEFVLLPVALASFWPHWNALLQLNPFLTRLTSIFVPNQNTLGESICLGSIHSSLILFGLDLKLCFKVPFHYYRHRFEEQNRNVVGAFRSQPLTWVAWATTLCQFASWWFLSSK